MPAPIGRPCRNCERWVSVKDGALISENFPQVLFGRIISIQRPQRVSLLNTTGQREFDVMTVDPSLPGMIEKPRRLGDQPLRVLQCVCRACQRQQQLRPPIAWKRLIRSELYGRVEIAERGPLVTLAQSDASEQLESRGT